MDLAHRVRAEVDRAIPRLLDLAVGACLDRLANAPGGIPGLRRIGTGSQDAASAALAVETAQAFGPHPALPAPEFHLHVARSLGTHDPVPRPDPGPLLARSFLPPTPTAPAPDDAQAMLAARTFGVH